MLGSGVGMIPETRLTLSVWPENPATRGLALQARLCEAAAEVACLLRDYLIPDQEVVDERSLVWGEPQFDPADGQRGRIEVAFGYRASLGCQDREYSDRTRLHLFFEIRPGELRLFGPEIPEPASTFKEF
jgi:hypothetical protein